MVGWRDPTSVSIRQLRTRPKHLRRIADKPCCHQASPSSARSLAKVSITSQFIEESGLWVIDIPSVADETNDHYGLVKAVDDIARAGGGPAQLWIHGITDEADAAAQAIGASAYRDLWQVRCPLPAARSTLETRAFTPADTDALVRVNNRAFSWHPEQSGMTRESLEATMAEPWFNADGFRLYERDGELLGFCWTKVHADMDPVHGEIYVIAVDPSAHGQGLGTPMTLAGLDWISDQGIEHALLYVESDNDPANATYRKIGFRHYRTDRAYNLTIDASV